MKHRNTGPDAVEQHIIKLLVADRVRITNRIRRIKEELEELKKEKRLVSNVKIAEKAGLTTKTVAKYLMVNGIEP